MRTEIHIKEIYEYSELSDKAKERAREAYVETIHHYDWWEHTIWELENTVLPMLGFECTVGFQLSYCQSDHARITGEYSYKSGGLKRLKQEWPNMPLIQYFEDLQELQRKNFYGVFAQLNTSHWIRYDIENEHRDEVTDEDGFKDVFRWLEQAIYEMLRDEYEDICSDKAVEDAILANGYEYLEDGSPY